MVNGYYDMQMYNGTAGGYEFSPVTLNQRWPRLERLILLLVFSLIGILMNGFFIASFFIEQTLRKIGNVFHACVGVADAIITMGVLPICTIVVLSGEWDYLGVCKLIHFLGVTSTYMYSVFFMLLASECLYRVSKPLIVYDKRSSKFIIKMAESTFAACAITAGVGVFLKLDYDYCERKYTGNFYFRTITTTVFHVIPSCITVTCLATGLFKIRKRASVNLQYKRSQQYDRDYTTSSLNLVVYTVYMVMWIPYLVMAYIYPWSSDMRYYNCVWIGIIRAVFISFIYSVSCRNFRRAFARLFNYCCCKNTLSNTFASRHRRDCCKPSCDVRVHIMHRMVASNSPHRQRGASSSRETQEL